MRKRGFFRYSKLFCIAISVLFFIISIFLFTSTTRAAETTMAVTGMHPPYAIRNIPDQIWGMNSNLTNSINLFNYFQDDTGYITGFTSTPVQNIQIVINQTTGEVSFYPDIGFSGVRNVTFSAFDNDLSGDSNVVGLFVSNDTEAPQWISYGSTPTAVNQNTLVNFSAVWTDNVQLGGFIFSINQGTGWVNTSFTPFSGIYNSSFRQVQISAPEGTTVLWTFYAFDTSNNMNQTPIQFITVLSQQQTTTPVPPAQQQNQQALPQGLINSILGQKQNQNNGFTVSPSDMAIQLKQGEMVTKLIKITNTGQFDLNLTLKSNGLDNYLILNNKSLSLKPGEEEVIPVTFFASRHAVVDSYSGSIDISTKNITQEVPILLVINPYNINFDIAVKVPDKYKQIMAGQTAYGQLTIKNNGDPFESPITLYYAILDITGNVVASNQEIIRNYSQNLIELNKSFPISESVYPGDYVFFARITENQNSTMGLDEFYIGQKFDFFAFISENILLILIILACIVTAMLMIYYHRTKEKQRLLNLYIMINDMKSLLEQNKLEEATSQFVKIKRIYKEKVTPAELSDKVELKIEMEKLIKDFTESMAKNQEVKATNKEVKPQVQVTENKSADNTKTQVKNQNKDEVKSKEKTAEPEKEKKVEPVVEEKKDNIKADEKKEDEKKVDTSSKDVSSDVVNSPSPDKNNDEKKEEVKDLPDNKEKVKKSKKSVPKKGKKSK